MVLRKLIAREVRRRPGRAILTLLSITIGIAAVVAVSMGKATTREAYRRMYDEIAGRAALEVSAEGGTRFSEKVAAVVEKVAGVDAAVPSFQRPSVMFFQHKRLDVMVLGIDPAGDLKVRDYDPGEGRFLESTDDDGAMLEIGFARAAGIKLGDEVKVMTTSGRPPLKSCTVVGLLAPRGAAAFTKGSSIVLGLRTAQRYFGRRGEINTIDIVLKSNADERAVAAAVRAVLPPGVSVHPPALRTQLATGTTVEIEQGLYMASGFALILALLIIINTFLMNASERRPQLAILRAVGATRRQLLLANLAEGLVMGIIGTVLGCVLGTWGGHWIMVSVARVYTSTPPAVAVPLGPFLLAAVLGPAVALVASVAPAYAATRISPLEAMQPVVSKNGVHFPLWLTILGLLVGGVTAVLLVSSILGWLPQWVVIPSGIALVTLLVPLVPAVVAPLSAVVAWVLRPLLRTEARMAHRQVCRRPIRSGLTIGVVYIAMCVGIGLGHSILNTVDDIRTWARETIQGDYFLRAAMPNTVTGQTAEVPLGLLNEIRQRVPNLQRVDGVRFFSVTVHDQKAFVVAREFVDHVPPVNIYHADPDVVREQLQQGQVVIGTVLAKELGISPGQEITLNTKEGPRPVRVASLGVDYMVGGWIIYMKLSDAQRFFQIDGVSVAVVTARPGHREEVEAGLAKIAGDHQLMMQSLTDLNRMIERTMAGVVGGLWGLLVLVFVVAALGISNTLTMNVLEQTRELALLRVVAMTRGQVRGLVLAQAGIIGILGLGMGLVGGLVFAKAISLSAMPVLGYPLPFHVHAWLVAACLAIGLAKVLGAAMLPAERAARLDLLIALQYE